MSLFIGAGAYLYNKFDDPATIGGLNSVMPSGTFGLLLSYQYNIERLTGGVGGVILAIRRGTLGNSPQLIVRHGADPSTNNQIFFIDVGNGRLQFNSTGSPLKHDGLWHSIQLTFNSPTGLTPPTLLVEHDVETEVEMVQTGGLRAGDMIWQNNYYFVGRDPLGVPNDFPLTGTIANLWFSPMNIVVVPKPYDEGGTPTSPIPAPSGAVPGAWLVGVNPNTGVIYQGRPGFDGNLPLLPYPNAGLPGLPPLGGPPIFLRGGGDLFPRNHSANASFSASNGSPIPATRFIQSGSGIIHTGSCDPRVGSP